MEDWENKYKRAINETTDLDEGVNFFFEDELVKEISSSIISYQMDFKPLPTKVEATKGLDDLLKRVKKTVQEKIDTQILK